jgi:hypothetical protein
MKFELQFAPGMIQSWALRYGTDDDDSEALRVGAAARVAGELSRDDFLAIAKWKTQRTGKQCRSNSEAYVRQVTSSALAASEPRFKIEVLRLLNGVAWPTASVILHFCDAAQWPILDFRAFWSLGQREPVDYDYSVWEAYYSYTRTIAQQANVSMRALDRALWAYSKVNQPAEAQLRQAIP